MQKLSLRDITNDFIDPVSEVTFFQSVSSKGTDPDNFLLKPKIQLLNEWHARLNAIIQHKLA